MGKAGDSHEYPFQPRISNSSVLVGSQAFCCIKQELETKEGYGSIYTKQNYKDLLFM